MQRQPDDRRLLLACRRGNDAAARDLYALHAPSLLSYARTIDAASAEDAVQSAFCTVLTRPVRELRGVRHVRAWLTQIVRNEMLGQLRSHRRSRARERRHLPVQSAATHEFTHDVAEMLTMLPRREREIIVLKHVAELTFEQISLALDVNPNTASSRYRSGMRRLREMHEQPRTTHHV
ncbi:MAG: sigma-70 family RNA polymerase sigma factor [Planctomycetota bacterium]